MLEAHLVHQVSLETHGFCPIEKPSVQEMIAPAITYISDQVKATMANISHLEEATELASDIVHTINTLENLQIQFQFIVDILDAKSDEDIPMIKRKFKLVNETKYASLVSKEQINTSAIEDAIKYLFKKSFPQTKKVLDQCFELDYYKEVTLIDNTENAAHVRVLMFRLGILADHFPQMISLSKDDIFSHDKSSPVWQDLFKSASIKKYLTKQDIKDSFKMVCLASQIMNVIVKNHYEGKATKTLKQDFKTYFTLLKDILYYGANDKKAELESMLYLTRPTIENAFKICDLCDHPTLVALTDLQCPTIGDECMIYIPRLFPQITKKLVLSEYDNNTINKLNTLETPQFDIPELKEPLAQIVHDLTMEGDNKIPIRIMSPVPLKFREDLGHHGLFTFRGLAKKIGSAFSNGLNDEGIVIHIHGGGFVTMSSASHRQYLTRWVKQSGLIHFSIDYRLAPKDPYPAAVDDVWQSYLWIINYAKTVLGIKTDKVVLVGDSAGGNLVLALALRIAKAGLPPPKGCLVNYPALYLNDSHYTPSLLHSIDDAILPYGVLKLVLKAYVQEEFKPLEDPFLSPLVASDELLARLPPIRFVTGSDDPLHDDNWRLLSKLRKLNKDARIILHQDMLHGYLCNVSLKNYELYNNEACELVKELMDI